VTGSERGELRGQPAGAADDSSPATGQASDARAYPLPAHLTPGGLKAFTTEVDRYATQLCAELERQAFESLSRGGSPEHTADSVAEARRAYVRRLQMDAIEQAAVKSTGQEARESAWAVLSAILVTIATVGLGVMPRFLHSTWQRVLFIGFAVVGVVGLGLMWTGRRHARSKGQR
jgi:hypothetical protein